MFLLTNLAYEKRGNIAVFSTLEKAQQHASLVAGRNDLQWSDPKEHYAGIVWVNSAGATFIIEPIDCDPTEVKKEGV